MAQKTTNSGNNPKKQFKQPIGKETSKKAPVANLDLLDTLDNFFVRREKLFLYLGLGLTVLFAILLFDVKVGPGGDDSAYISRTYDFVHGFKYPGYQGALYPLVLSPFVWLFGIKLPLLKGLSLIFTVVSMYFFYKAFSKRIPQTIIAISFILLSCNYYILYFSSQTYSEAFFLMVQAIFFWFMSTRFIGDDTRPLKDYLLLGLLLFLLTLTKNIAYITVGAVLGYFLLYKKWKSILYTLGGFFAFFVPFEIIKRIVWGTKGLQFAAQGNGLMYKDFYNPTKGKEDLAGFIHRFFENSDLYFSKHLFRFLGLRSELPETNTILTLIAWAFLALALYWTFRKSKLMLLTSLYVILICTGTFLSVQPRWDQWRLIIIVFPFILLLFSSVLYYASKKPKLKFLQIVIPVLGIIIFFCTFSITKINAKRQGEILSHNLSGNLLYGLTPDWENYIQMSKWSAKNVSKDYQIASRKADISFIYSERKFYGITKIPSIALDSLLKLISDSAIYIGVSMEKITNTPLMTDPAFRTKIVGMVNGKFSFGDTAQIEGNVVGIYRFPKSEASLWEEKIKLTGLHYDKNISGWLKNLNNVSPDYAIYLPDYLLGLLRDNKVKYMLLGSLRMNPNENTGNIINTLHRYIYMIQLKYPDIFRVTNTIGTEEPAQLVEVTTFNP